MLAGMAADPDATQDLDDTAPGGALAAGQRVLGRYVLQVELGRGGMGVVWRAQDEMLGEMVALKFLPDYVARDAVALDELKEETRRARRLTHPHIVRVHDFTQEDGLAAVSMEYVDGATLAQRRLEQPGRVLSVAALAPLATQVCAALAYAHHAAKTAHRDLKPANILVTSAGDAKVTDFGIARSLTETRTRLTSPGKGGVSGTLPYMSPQQLRGDKPLATDDIYALGATLYELLAGKPPFHRGDLAILMLQIRQRPPPSIAAKRAELGVEAEPVPRQWEETIMACLAKESEVRPQSAEEVAARLRMSDGVARKRVSGPAREKAVQSRGAAPRRGWRVLVGGAAAVMVAAGLLLWRTTGPDETHAHRASSPAPKSEVQSLPAVAPKETATPAPAAPVAEPVPVATPVPPPEPRPGPIIVRETFVKVWPAEAEARLWLGPFSEFLVQGGRAVLPDVPEGEHDLVVQAEGYEPYTAKVAVKDGRAQAEVRLVRVKGSLEVTARPGTLVLATSAAGEKTVVGTVGLSGVLDARDALAIGSYALRLEHAECEPVEIGRVEVNVGRLTRLAPSQAPLPARLLVTSQPAGAEVRINGVVAGQTPLALPKLASEQPVRVELALAGYRRAERSVRLAARVERELDFGALDPESGTIALRMSSATFPLAEAEVKVDGKRVAPKRSAGLWTIENVVAGSRVVEVLHRDYEPWRQAVEVRDRQNREVIATPIGRPAILTLDVAGPREYTVRLDSKQVEVVDRRVVVPAQRPVAVEVRAAGYRPAIGSVTLDPGMQRTMPIILERQPMPRAGNPHENTLRMKFVPVPGLSGLFSIWETREQDFELFLHATKKKSRLPEGVVMVSDKPSVKMTWDEARAFCEWLTALERSEGALAPTQHYRLPTDAEWSVAVGLGRETGKSPAEKSGRNRELFPWGKLWPPPARVGNYAGEELGLLALNLVGYNDGFEGIAPVGRFPPNGFGLHDLGGNVWEWCEDEYQPGSGQRVLRGASFADHEAGALLASVRAKTAPETSSPNLGFRCVLETGMAGR